MKFTPRTICYTNDSAEITIRIVKDGTCGLNDICNEVLRAATPLLKGCSKHYLADNPDLCRMIADSCKAAIVGLAPADSVEVGIACLDH